MKLAIIIGARPNYMKIPRFRELGEGFEIKIIHTGQHYDEVMKDVFLKEFDIVPDEYIHLTGTTPASKIADIIVGLEDSFTKDRPDCVIVVGDVDSSLAAALTANKLGIKLAHIEAGLRSYDRSMPEERNRVIIDNLSDMLFITEDQALTNLLKEGIRDNIYMVGDPMIETLIYFSRQIDQSEIKQKLRLGKYVLMTIHRQSNTDNEENLKKIVEIIKLICKGITLVFPMHHRFKKGIDKFRIDINIENLLITRALGYFDFQNLLKDAKYILTDSGGIQSEAAYRGVLTILLRDRTEKEFCHQKNLVTLCGLDINKINTSTIFCSRRPIRDRFWDDKVTERTLNYIKKWVK